MKLLTIRAITITAVLVLTPSVTGQGRERVIIWQWQSAAPFPGPVIRKSDGEVVPSDVMALEVVSILVAGRPVSICQPFGAGDDWMKDVKVRVKNVSEKPIVSARLHLTLPQAKSGEALLGVGLKHDGGKGASEREEDQKVIMPGDEFILARTKEEYEHDRQWIAESSGVTSVSRVWFGRISARFEDGTVWGGFPRISGIQVNSSCQ